jgi:DNA-binding response OmpR family regulator
VVEDDAAIRRLVVMVLQRNGYRVDFAADGLEAVLKLGIAEFDVIVLDLMMPNLDGFTFLNTFAENDPAVLRKVIVTSAASPAVMRERLVLEPFAVLPKPFDINDLVAKVRACIDSQK